MGSLCLSAPTILRCESFTRIENLTLLIPTAIELLAATSLIYTNRHRGRRHLLLTLEGWTYFALALLDMLSHILPAAQEGANTFKIFDTILAALSFVPMLLFMIFLYLITRTETIPLLPRRLQRLLQLLLLISIPGIISLNIVSAFIGISQRVIRIGSNEVLAIGFATTKDSTLWSFFTSITLALYTGYQAITWALLFYRLLRAVLGQRRIENASKDSAHLIRGTGWLNLGVKLGAVETVIGFVIRGGFGMALVRRIGRAISRVSLCIGIVKGMDYLEDFQKAREEMTPKREQPSQQLRPRPLSQVSISHIRQLISNPRFSTFRQISPVANEVSPSSIPKGYSNFTSPTDEKSDLYEAASFRHDTPDAKYGLYLHPSQGQLSHPQSMARVTVVSNSAHDGAPTLHMRFSDLGLPSPATIVDHIKTEFGHNYGRRYSAADGELSSRARDVDEGFNRQASKRRETVGGASSSVGDGEWSSEYYPTPTEGLGKRTSAFSGANMSKMAFPAPALIREYTYSTPTRFKSFGKDNEKQARDRGNEPNKLRKNLRGSTPVSNPQVIPPLPGLPHSASSVQPNSDRPILRINTSESKNSTTKPSLDRSESQSSRRTTLSRNSSYTKRKPPPPLIPTAAIDDDKLKSSTTTSSMTPEIVFAYSFALGHSRRPGAPAGPRPPVSSVWNPDLDQSSAVAKSELRSIDPFESDDEEDFETEDGTNRKGSYSGNGVLGRLANSSRPVNNAPEHHLAADSLPPSRASSPTCSPKPEPVGLPISVGSLDDNRDDISGIKELSRSTTFGGSVSVGDSRHDYESRQRSTPHVQGHAHYHQNSHRTPAASLARGNESDHDSESMYSMQTGEHEHDYHSRPDRDTFGQQDGLELGRGRALDGNSIDQAPHQSYPSTESVSNIATQSVVPTQHPNSQPDSEMETAKGTASVVRVKSIGHAPHRRTPFPIRPLPGPIRGSVHVQPILVTDKTNAPVSPQRSNDDADGRLEIVRWKGKGKEVTDVADMA